MCDKQSPCFAVHGFALLSMTLILVFIMISASLSFAHIQQQRIQRNQFHLNYLKARIIAVNELDLFYMVLYESPELFALVAPCTNLTLDSRQVVIPNDMMREYRLSALFYLCVEREGVFNVSLALPYNNIEQLVVQRKLITTLEHWVWQPSSLFGF
ncbi:hypothetical protein [Moritella yayanosii]|uniref:Uncharacterized protein n=1 Tax=Moritella yayanosii TaxID=69539 RepID=A0A330LQX8_9GAMM|nr:hypothetical protein [Moritella yayanosii]SQD78596.1 conserved protein of unknown function [Moritella yayanosii]